MYRRADRQASRLERRQDVKTNRQIGGDAQTYGHMPIF